MKYFIKITEFFFALFFSFFLLLIPTLNASELRIYDEKTLPVLPHQGNDHNAIHELNTNYKLYQICKNDIEGYSQKRSGGDYTYPSLREDIRDAMIARASTGKMGFEFLTGKIHKDFYYETVSLSSYINLT